MRQALDDFLCNKYPDIFRDRHGDETQTAMVWGFECGDGWFDIIDNLCASLSVIAKMSGIKVIATQVKEKFGALRFYYETYHDSVESLSEEECKLVNKLIKLTVDFAEGETERTCEMCGGNNKRHEKTTVSINGWIYNLCEHCLEISDRLNKKDFPRPVIHPEIK